MMEFIFGTAKRNGAYVENLKTVGATHSDYTLGGFMTIQLEYFDSVITDTFRVDSHYKTDEDAEGNCYDWYAISEHYRNIDKTPPVAARVATTEEIINALLGAEEGSDEQTTEG